jgi:DNA polymerase
MTAIGQLRSRISDCTACALSHTRNKVVPGEGPAPAKVLIIGEGPGFEEDIQGRPFCGPTGEFLDSLLDGIGLRRTHCFVDNVIRCRAPRNRDPRPEEMAACHPWSEETLGLVDPQVVLALGRYASQVYLPGVTPAAVRGSARWIGGILHFFTYHPAAVLHGPGLEPEVRRQFSLFRSLL